MRHNGANSESMASTAFVQMLEKVRYAGAYPTRERAEEAVRLVLSGLGRRVSGPEREELARCLPPEAARMLTRERPVPDPALTGWGFVKELSSRSRGTLATTRWDVGSVLTTVAALAGPELVTRLLAQLPPGYGLLFGQAELTQAA